MGKLARVLVVAVVVLPPCEVAEQVVALLDCVRLHHHGIRSHLTSGCSVFGAQHSQLRVESEVLLLDVVMSHVAPTLLQKSLWPMISRTVLLPAAMPPPRIISTGCRPESSCSSCVSSSTEESRMPWRW